MSAKVKILAVDDDFINLKLLQSILKKNESVREVIEAKNGLEAINILQEQSDVNLILLDLKMPIMDGIEFLNNISSMPDIKDIPVIVITTDETRKREAFDFGAFDFLLKPIRDHELRDKIQKIIDVL